MAERIPESLRHIREQGLRGAPKPLRKKFHALTADQLEVMIGAGFLKKEVREFDSSTGTNFESQSFQNMIRSRRRYVNALQVNGWSNKEIRQKIQGWYRKKEKRSPWDFLDTESKNLRQKPVMSDRQWNDYLILRRDLSAHFGRAYGRVQAVRPQFLMGIKGLPRRKQG